MGINAKLTLKIGIYHLTTNGRRQDSDWMEFQKTAYFTRLKWYGIWHSVPSDILDLITQRKPNAEEEIEIISRVFSVVAGVSDQRRDTEYIARIW